MHPTRAAATAHSMRAVELSELSRTAVEAEENHAEEHGGIDWDTTNEKYGAQPWHECQ